MQAATLKLISPCRRTRVFSICYKKKARRKPFTPYVQKGMYHSRGLMVRFMRDSFRILIGLEHFHQRLLENEDAPSDSHGRQLA